MFRLFQDQRQSELSLGNRAKSLGQLFRNARVGLHRLRIDTRSTIQDVAQPFLARDLRLRLSLLRQESK